MHLSVLAKNTASLSASVISLAGCNADSQNHLQRSKLKS